MDNASSRSWAAKPAYRLPDERFRDERVDLHRIDVDGLGLTLHEQLAVRLDGDPVAEPEPGVLVDQDRPSGDLRVRFEACGEVDRVTDTGVGRAVLRARIAGDDRPGCDADADRDLGPPARGLLVVEQADQFDHLPRCAHGSLVMVLAR